MHKKVDGVTLIEITIAGAIVISVCCLLLIPFFLSTHKSMQRQNNKIFVEQNARLTMDWLTPKIRGAYSIIHEREIGKVGSKKTFYSRNNGTDSLLTLLSYATDRKGNIRKGTNTLINPATQTAIWNVYQYRLVHKCIKFDDELWEDRYEVLNTNDADPFKGSWTALSLVESIKCASYIRPYIGTNTGLQFEYWKSDGTTCYPEEAVYLTIKIHTKVGSGTPYCQEAYLKSDVFIRKKAKNF